VWRAFFLAIGTMLIIVGIECMLIESAVLVPDSTETTQVANAWYLPPQPMQVSNRVIRPPEWIPWSLVAAGTIVVLYSLTIPKRWGSKGGE
jgi:hypothetical protein